MADAEVATVEKARPRNEFTEIGRSGLRHTGGWVDEEFLNNLKGTKSIKVYKEMRDNDPIIGAVMLAILNLVRQAEWNVEPWIEDDADEPTEQAEADARFVRECMKDMDKSWKDLISEIMSMIVFGWAYFETVYKQRDGGPMTKKRPSMYTDGKIGWGKIALRSQDSLERWGFDDNGDLTGMYQRAFPDYRERFLPLSKGLLFRTSVWKDNPEGRSVLRNAYRPWFFKKRMEEVEGIGIERDLNGIPVAYVPPEILTAGASAEQKQTLAAVEQMVQNIRNDSQAGLVVPAMYDENGNKLFWIELLTTLGKRNFDLNATINRMNLTIATSMLADFVLIGQDNVGSFALASSKTQVFSTAIGSYLDTICDVFNKVEIPRLMELNGNVTHKLPQLAHGDIETVSLEDLADYLNALSGAGVDLTGDDMLTHLARQAGIPENALDVKPEPTGGTQPFLTGEGKVTPNGVEVDADEEDDE